MRSVIQAPRTRKPYLDESAREWFVKAARKGPFYLLREEPEFKRGYGSRYYLLWNDLGKCKLSVVSDGMTTRYGFDTLAVVKGAGLNTLWVQSERACSDEDIAALIKFSQGCREWEEFELSRLRDLVG